MKERKQFKSWQVLGLLALLCAALWAGYIWRQAATTNNTHTTKKAAITPKAKTAKPAFRSGDIIFQNSISSQSKAIQLATHSEYTHCGILFQRSGGWWVLEAVQPVRWTRLDEWVARGAGAHYVAKRLRADSLLTSEVVARLQQVGLGFLGKDYDLAFGWSDERIYCSELVWKMYERTTGLKLGQLLRLRDFDLTSAVVKQKLQERYGNHIPLDEPVISPAAVLNSELLVTVAKE